MWRNRQRHDDGLFGRQRVAFVLSGGGSLGAMQAGQLLAMFEAGITPDLVIGVSAGALNGAAVAYDPSIAAAEQLATIWQSLDRDYIFRGSRVERAWHVLRGHPNLYRSDGLVDLVNRFLPVNNLSELSTPFEACTVNIDDARLDFHSTGDPRKVLVASASLPGVFRPVVINGSRHVDGGIAATLPVQRAHDLGATTIFAFDCRAGTKHQLAADLSALGVLTSSIAVTREILTPSHDHLNVVCLPAPDVSGIGLFDFSQGSRLIAEGHDMVAAFLANRPQVMALHSSGSSAA
ncbi:MAG: patatin-like phospholipase family protein [Ilumatobacteraceae bacterium]|nr:patatin-like phospholipase family protein [Ilumatobacteraceae bacterium]